MSWTKNALKASRDCFLSELARSERRITSKAFPQVSPPIVVVGPPRSGTTLIYQAFVRALHLSYFCNWAARFPESPALATRVFSMVKRISPPDCFSSNYGETSGWQAPSQGRHIWVRWFPVDQPAVDSSDLTSSQVGEIQGTVAIIEGAMNGPFINKAQAHCVRIPNLVEIFPELVLVRIFRDPFYTAQSILLGRRAVFQDETHWFSVKPNSYEEVKGKSALGQVCEQVYYLDRDMDRDISRLGLSSVFNIHYEEFCSDPNKIINQFMDFYQKICGIHIRRRCNVPSHFKISKSIRMSENESSELRKQISDLWAKAD